MTPILLGLTLGLLLGTAYNIGVGVERRRKPRRPVDLEMIRRSARKTYEAQENGNHDAGTILYDLASDARELMGEKQAAAAFERALAELQEEKNDGTAT